MFSAIVPKSYPWSVRRFLPKKQTLIKYAVISVLLGIGFYFYTDDHDAPTLRGFHFEQRGGFEREYEFGGNLTDARGVSDATFECVTDEETKLVIVVTMSGNDRNKTSFGILSRSPNWAGSWKGTSYDLDFTGRAVFPNSKQDIACSWRANLRDNLGNNVTLTELAETKIRIG